MVNKKERTFVMVKHDGVQRALVGEIIKRIEQTGLKLVALKMMVPTREKAVEHYGKDDVWYESKGQIWVDNLKKEGKTPEKPAIEYGKAIIEGVLKYIVSGPAVAMVIEGPNAVGVVKKLVGGTEPLSSDVGTIRGDYTIDSYPMANMDNRGVRNLVHCSDQPDEAAREIEIWFNNDELISYRHINEAMLFDVDLDGYLE